MQITIRRSDLVLHGACEPGLDWFDAFVKVLEQDTDLTVNWDPFAMVMALTNRGAQYWCGWAIEKGIIPSWSLAKVDLTGTNLRGANLTDANLSGADLTEADLPRAYLRRANLTGTNLTGTYLTGAYLNDANIVGAKLYGTNFYGADLTGAYYPYGNVPAGWHRQEDGFLVRV
jgi:uncharacterized protein YjbI with pentapeptide repeats